MVGHIIDVNPAHAVCGPKQPVRKGKTPVLTAEEARPLADSVPVTRTAIESKINRDNPPN